jgi:hypothetical protein
MIKQVPVNDGNGQTTVMTHDTYEVTKKLVQVVLPALATLYFALSKIWGLPKAEEVMGTITAIAAFLGVCLGISANRYNASDAPHDGKLVVVKDPGGVQQFQLQLDGDPEDLAEKDAISFKVKKTNAA